MRWLYDMTETRFFDSFFVIVFLISI